ncbi:MAG: hypothetical protein ABSA18_09955 [Dehalococcoidia bacterium]|jgi:hypothetical protein
MSEEKQHFHVEINSIKVEGMMVKFNIFADTLAQVTSDLEAVIAYVTGSAPLPQQQAALPAQAAKSAPAAKPPAVKKPLPVLAPAQAVVCCACGSESVEWVTGTRKDNGKSFAAFKCQECGKWQPEAKP